MTPETFDAGSEQERDTDGAALLVAYRNTLDETILQKLMKMYERELFSYLRRYLGNAEMAEDVMQQTWLKVFEKLHTFEEGKRFKPWLYAIATHAAVDAQRSNKRHRMVSLDEGESGKPDAAKLVDLLVSDCSGPVDTALQQELEQQLHKARQKLPEAMRNVVELVYFRGLKYREAAEALSIPVGTVKSRLHSALEKLRTLQEQSSQVPPEKKAA